MKKAIFILSLVAISLSAFGQASIAPLKTIDSTYHPDPKRLYNVVLTIDQLSTLTTTSRAGLIPYLRTTKLPMDQLDGVEKGFNALHDVIAKQVNDQMEADRLKCFADKAAAANKDTKKKQKK